MSTSISISLVSEVMTDRSEPVLRAKSASVSVGAMPFTASFSRSQLRNIRPE